MVRALCGVLVSLVVMSAAGDDSSLTAVRADSRRVQARSPHSTAGATGELGEGATSGENTVDNSWATVCTPACGALGVVAGVSSSEAKVADAVSVAAGVNADGATVSGFDAPAPVPTTESVTALLVIPAGAADADR